MKILHLALQAPYNEGWGYQENLLTKHQAKMGHDVILVTTCKKNTETNGVQTCELEDYISPDGFRVVRLSSKKGVFKRVYTILNIYDIYDLLKELSPDFVMVHGLGSFSALQVKKYVKKCNQRCVVIADTHIDENNSSVLRKSGVKSSVYLCLLRWLNARMRKCYKKVYGVSPRRTEIAETVFRFPADMLGTLPAGADDDKICFSQKTSVRRDIREKHGISDDDFLIVTGGKIDEKKNIDSLMKAISNINRKNVKLLVFGNCSNTIKETIENLAKHESMRYIGWISSDEVYNYYLAADLVVFPGLHSVLWEQACAAKVPCLFNRLKGFTHFDVGGNCQFMEEVSPQGLKLAVEKLIFTDEYYKMKAVAESELTDVFLYSNIAQKALEAYE